MDRQSTNRISTARIAVLFGIALCGCRTQSTSMSNPFMAPDRVPPPSTRVIAPGTAQPYYPGDPLPAAAVPPPPAAAVAGAPTAPPPAPPTSPPTQPPITPIGASSPPAKDIASTNERNVAIPTDNEDLRFALPPPPQQTAPTPLQAASNAPGITASQPTPVAAPTNLAPSPANAVAPAVFNQDAAALAAPTAADAPPSSGGWRSPQVAQNGGAVAASHTAPATTATSPPPASPPVAANTMPVQLRAVTPPPTTQMVQPAYSAPPRIRFSDFFGGSQPQAAPAPMPVAQPIPTALQPTTSTSPDGFRPRGSTR